MDDVHWTEKECPVQNKDVAWREVDGEAVLVITQKSEIKVLNEVGTYIWKACDGDTNLVKIAEGITQDFEVDYSEAIEDVRHFVEELSSLQMIK